MSQKARDYTNLRETEKLYDAIGDMQTYIKDYSLVNLISIHWRWDAWATRKRLVLINIFRDLQVDFGVYHAPDILPVINDMLERSTHDKDRWLPRERHEIASYQNEPPLVIDTTLVNEESLRDHIAQVGIGYMFALVDLQELLKATRYA